MPSSPSMTRSSIVMPVRMLPRTRPRRTVPWTASPSRPSICARTNSPPHLVWSHSMPPTIATPASATRSATTNRTLLRIRITSLYPAPLPAVRSTRPSSEKKVGQNGPDARRATRGFRGVLKGTPQEDTRSPTPQAGRFHRPSESRADGDVKDPVGKKVLVVRRLPRHIQPDRPHRRAIADPRSGGVLQIADRKLVGVAPHVPRVDEHRTTQVATYREANLDARLEQRPASHRLRVALLAERLGVVLRTQLPPLVSAHAVRPAREQALKQRHTIVLATVSEDDPGQDLAGQHPSLVELQVVGHEQGGPVIRVLPAQHRHADLVREVDRGAARGIEQRIRPVERDSHVRIEQSAGIDEFASQLGDQHPFVELAELIALGRDPRASLPATTEAVARADGRPHALDRVVGLCLE